MSCFGRLTIAALLLIAAAPAGAEEAPPPPHRDSHAVHACLDQKARQAANESGRVVHLATALRAARKRMPGTLVRARLCNGKDGLVYVLTILARDGRVARLTVDAVKGTVVGKR